MARRFTPFCVTALNLSVGAANHFAGIDDSLNCFSSTYPDRIAAYLRLKSSLWARGAIEDALSYPITGLEAVSGLPSSGGLIQFLVSLSCLYNFAVRSGP
jgi:hypothetical protein